MTTFAAALDHALRSDPGRAPLPDVDAWWARHTDETGPFAGTAGRALIGGFAADRVGFAFASGYHEALRALLPNSAPGDRKRALCATEEGGAHPRAIQTTLRPREGAAGFTLSGHKRWATLGTAADVLLVVARRPDLDARGRPQLVVVRVLRDDPGVRFESMGPTPFAPEIGHAQVHLDAVPVAPDRVLPGDGYADYLKPFRTVEDCHVHLAAIGHLIGIGRRSGWPRPTLAGLAASAVTIAALTAEDPRAPAVHVALGGALDGLHAVLESASAGGLWDRLEADVRTRWDRDRPLLAVASRARSLRLEAAWKSFHTTRAE